MTNEKLAAAQKLANSIAWTKVYLEEVEVMTNDQKLPTEAFNKHKKDVLEFYRAELNRLLEEFSRL